MNHTEHHSHPSTVDDRRFWVRLGLAASCAILLPVVVVMTAQITDGGALVRATLAWLIAVLAGLAVYASATASAGTSVGSKR